MYIHVYYDTLNALWCVNKKLFLHLQVEIKNLNSFSSMNRAIDHEISRQVNLISQGNLDEIVQETRLWEEGSQVIS